MKFKKTTILGLSFAMGALVFAGGALFNDKAVASANEGDNVNASFVMDDKAEMLLRANAEESGVRFLATMTHEDYLALIANEGADKTYKDISFGMVIFPADYEEYSEVNFTTLFSDDEDAKKYDWATWNDGAWVYAGENGANGSDVRIMNFTSDELILTSPEENSYYALHGTIKNILPDNYARAFVGRAYITYTAQDGTVSYEWAAWAGNDASNNTCSVAYLAQTALETPEDFTDSQITLLNAYVEGASTTDTTVSVEHYQETLDGDYELMETTTQTAKVNRTATATANTYEGFTVDKTVAGTQDVVMNALADGKSTLKLYYTRNVHNVVFETNGGSAVASVPVKYGATYTVDAETTKAGETFGGWYFGNEYTEANKANEVVMGDADVTVNAMWLTVAWEEAKSSVALKWHATDAQGLDNTYTLAAPSVMANGAAYDNWDYEVSESLTIDGNTVKTNGATNGVVSVVVNGTALSQKTVTIRDISDYRIIRTLADCKLQSATDKVILANDIDFENTAFVMASGTYNGEFDGNGYALKNIYISTAMKSYDGTGTISNNCRLFRDGLNASSYIHDLAILNVKIEGNITNGVGIFGYNLGRMINVYMEAIVVGGSSTDLGRQNGLVVYNNGTMQNVVAVVENRTTTVFGTLVSQLTNGVFNNCYSISMTANPAGKTNDGTTNTAITTNVMNGVSAYTTKEALLADTGAMAKFPNAFKEYLNDVYLGYNLPETAQGGKQQASFTLPVEEGVSYVSANEAIAKVENGAIVPVKGGDKVAEITYVYAVKNGKTVASYRVQVTDYTGYIVISQTTDLTAGTMNGTNKYILANDIDFKASVITSSWSGSTVFSGILDGNDFEVKNFTVAGEVQLFAAGSTMTIRDLTLAGKMNRTSNEGKPTAIVTGGTFTMYNVTMNLDYQGGDTSANNTLFGWMNVGCQLYGCTFNVEKTATAGNFPLYLATLIRENWKFYNNVVNSATMNGVTKQYRPVTNGTNTDVTTKDFFGVTFNDLSAE